MITDKVGGSSAKPEVSKQSKEKRLKHKVSGYKSQSKQRSIAGCLLLLRTLDDILENVEERFGYLENDPVLKAAAVLDPDVWPKDQIELSTYGDAEIELLANYYEDHLLRAGCELHQIVRKWSSVKSYVSLHLSRRCTEEIFATIFRSRMDDCCNFLLLAEIVLIWPLSTTVVERAFSSMNRVKTQLRVEFASRKLGWCA